MYSFQFTNDGKGQIQIDDFIESFESEFCFWSKSDYEKHWLKASEELSLGKDVSFITSITNPKNSNFIRTWTCYVKNRELIFHENILFLDDMPFEFNIATPHKNVVPYESVTEDGDEISEWRTKI